MCLYLCVKFEVSTLILTSFRQGVGAGGGGNFTLPRTSDELLKSPPRLGLRKTVFMTKLSCKVQYLKHYYKTKIKNNMVITIIIIIICKMRNWKNKIKLN